MRVGLACQQLSGSFSLALRAMAPLQQPVIEEEPQSAQIISAPLTAEARVAPEPTVEILDQGTGWDRLFSQFGDGFTDIVEATTQLLAQDSFLLPAEGIAVVAGEPPRHPTQQLGRALEFSPKQAQVLIELLRESQGTLIAPDKGSWPKHCVTMS